MLSRIKEGFGGFMYMFIKWIMIMTFFGELLISLVTFMMAFISWENVCHIIEVNHIYFAARVAFAIAVFVALLITVCWGIDRGFDYSHAWHKFRNINRYCWVIFLPILLSGCGSEAKIFYDCSNVKDNPQYIKAVERCRAMLDADERRTWPIKNYHNCLASTQQFFCKPYIVCEVKPKGEGVSK